jgi:hypothetical protein
MTGLSIIDRTCQGIMLRGSECWVGIWEGRFVKKAYLDSILLASGLGVLVDGVWAVRIWILEMRMFCAVGKGGVQRLRKVQ